MNYNKLKSFIKASPFNISDICELIGIAETTYYFQIKNERLSVTHLLAIADLLHLTDNQLLQILGRGEINEKNIKR